MEYVRTQIYLEPRQHRRLKDEAHRRGVSLTHLLRDLVDEGLDASDDAGGDLTSLIGLGNSARAGQRGSDVARHKDAYLGEALADKARQRA